MAAMASVYSCLARIELIALKRTPRISELQIRRRETGVRPEFEGDCRREYVRTEGCYAQPYDGSCFYERKIMINALLVLSSFFHVPSGSSGRSPFRAPSILAGPNPEPRRWNRPGRRISLWGKWSVHAGIQGATPPSLEDRQSHSQLCC